MPHPETRQNNPGIKHLAEFFNDARNVLERLDIDIDPPDAVLEDVVLMAMASGVLNTTKLMVSVLANGKELDEEMREKLIKEMKVAGIMYTTALGEMQNTRPREDFEALAQQAMMAVALIKAGVVENA